MALWQFDLYFIPIGACLPDTTGEEWDEPGLALSQVRTVQEALAYYFGPPWVMLNDWLVFGPENGNRVDVSFPRFFAFHRATPMQRSTADF